MKLYPKISQDAGRNRAIFIAVVLIFCGHAFASEHREKGYLYLSPVPGAEYVSPQTKFFLVRFETVNPNDIDNLDSFITVTGASSGNHPAQWTKIASDGRTVIFRISGDFSSNELVTVDLNPAKDPGASGTIDPYSYEFMTSGPMPAPPPPPPPPPSSNKSPAGRQALNAQVAPETKREASPPADMTVVAENAAYEAEAVGPMILPNGVSIPSDFPAMDIDIYGSTAPGYIFIDYSGSPSYTMIMENSGAPVWYQRGTAHRDFKVQRNGIITWTNFQGFDQNFNYLRSFGAVNGYSTDNHELKVLENGHYLLFGVRGQSVDMTRFVSRPPGNEYANVNETCLQEFTPEGDLIFQWRAWDNHDIRLVQYWSYDDDPRTAGSIRFTHMNSVDVDNDGHLVVSNKRVSEVTKINRDTGEVIWRLGSGQHPDDPNPDPYPDTRLTILNDPLDQFNVQHDIRVVGENRYSVFDNHHLDSNPNSRAVEYEVDSNSMTATMVWEYYGGYDSYHMGSAQRLPNGNTLINWVITSAPKVTEVQPDGTKVYEMNWSARNSKSYRVFRFPWTGVVEKPYLIVESYTDNITLIFNKFGDPDVDYYRIYGGTSSPPTTLLDTSTETLKRLYTGLKNGTNYFRVTAVDIYGAESVPSDVKSGYVNFTTIPGQNMVKNGDFSTGQDPWTWEVGGSASAVWLIEAGVSHFDITNGGTQMSDIRLFQAGMQLVQGKEYIFEFDAWSANLPRLIEAKVARNESPWTDYSKIGPMQITPNPTYYSHSFTMDEPSDFYARVEFNLGISPFDVYLDNVSLREDLPESEGVSIVLVSDAADPLTSGGNHEDDELVAWLRSLDYTVDTNGMNQNMQGDWSGDAAIQTAVAAADLIFVSRRTTSGNYNYDALWNTNLAKPVILQSGYLDREERWGWNTSDDDGDATPGTQQSMNVVAAGHPFLKGLSGSSIQIFDWDDPASTPNHTGLNQAPGSIYLSQSLDPGATLIGTFNGRAMLYEMAAGTVLASGDGTLGGHRVFFVNWSYDVEDADYRWDDYLTDDYKTILHNIIKDVLDLIPGDFDFDGCVGFDDLAVLVGEWPEEQGGLKADLDGNGKVDFNDFAIFAENWTGCAN